MDDGKKQVGIIKCPRCGEEYHIEEKALDKINAFYTCTCGYKLSIAFFTRCSSCGTIVGVDAGTHSYKELAQATTRRLLKNFNPLTIKLRGGASRLDYKDIPFPDGRGRCMLCGTTYVRCPYCHNGVELDSEYNNNPTIFCTTCGKEIRLK